MLELHERVVELVGFYAKGDYRIDGPELSVRCPFHSGGTEKRPSFYWNLRTGLFFCHSCQAHGGISQFLKLQGYSREDAQKVIAETRFDKHTMKRVSAFERKRGLDMMGANQVLPESYLGMDESFVPIRMLEWGFPEELLEQYEIGFDPYNERITFPIRDVYGRLIGFSGRADSRSVVPRYKIYKSELEGEFPGYALDKQFTLWNIHQLWARYVSGNARTLGRPVVILVEGFKAALWLIHQGYWFTVASMGTWLSEVQRYILSVLGAEVFVFMDNNPAGRKASRRIVRYLRMQSTCIPYEVCYPAGAGTKCQPDDLTGDQISTVLRRAYFGANW